MDPAVIALNVQREREKLGLSMEALSEAIRLRPSFLDQIERGSIKPHPQTLQKIADFLGCPLTSLVEEPKEPVKFEEVPLVALAGDHRFWLKLALYPLLSAIVLALMAAFLALTSWAYWFVTY